MMVYVGLELVVGGVMMDGCLLRLCDTLGEGPTSNIVLFCILTFDADLPILYVDSDYGGFIETLDAAISKFDSQSLYKLGVSRKSVQSLG